MKISAFMPITFINYNTITCKLYYETKNISSLLGVTITLLRINPLMIYITNQPLLCNVNVVKSFVIVCTVYI